MTSEAEVQSRLRLALAGQGYRLWRNNSGVAQYVDGRPVRFGLANDSPQLNAKLKSSDLIGWHPHVITLADVGRTVAIFTSLECKPSDWHLTPGDARGQAQQRWIDLVVADGGEARFVTSAD